MPDRILLCWPGLLVKSLKSNHNLHPKLQKLRWRAPWSRRWNGSGRQRGTWWSRDGISTCFKPQKWEAHDEHLRFTRCYNHCLKMDDKEKLGVSSIHFLDSKTHCHPHYSQFQLRFLRIWMGQLTMGQSVGNATEHWDQDHLPDQLQEIGPPDELTGGGETWLWSLGKHVPRMGIVHDLASFFCNKHVEVMWFNHQKKGFNWFWCVSNIPPVMALLCSVEKWW